MTTTDRSDPRIITIGSFFRAIEIDVSAIDQFPDAIEQIRQGTLHGVIVHNIYPPATLDRVVAGLERHDPPFVQTWFPREFQAFFYGRNLNLTPPEFPGYFRDAALFHQQLGELFNDAPALVPALSSILSRLDGGRPFVAAPGLKADEQYMFTTIRAHMEGGFIPPHCDVRPSHPHLRSLLDPHLMSFVLSLGMCEAGGALEVYDERVDLAGRDGRTVVRGDVAGLRSISFRLPVGSLILLDSGRYLHRVSPVIGKRKRWTACSFMSLNRNRDAVYCWG